MLNLYKNALTKSMKMLTYSQLNKYASAFQADLVEALRLDERNSEKI